MREVLKLVVVLSLICAVSAAALQIARVNLAPVIEKQNDKYVRGPALAWLFKKPADQLLENKVSFSKDGQTYPVFFDDENGKVTGLAVEAAGKGGYGGDIRLMIGINTATMKLAGMEIIQHSETPGVGARVEKEAFRKQWDGLPANETVDLQQNGGKIKAITGATFSSHAVIDGTNTIIKLVRDNRAEIMKKIEEKMKDRSDV